jgi:hypothetical protein
MDDKTTLWRRLLCALGVHRWGERRMICFERRPGKPMRPALFVSSCLRCGKDDASYE